MSHEFNRKMKYALSFLPDRLYLQMIYFRHFGRFINFKHPKTFNEKLQWLKVNNKNPLYTDLVDKYEAKKHIEKSVGKKYVIKTLAVYDNFDDIDFDRLPNKFVMKTTHDSGGVVIVKNKKEMKIEKVKEKINTSLSRNFFYYGREWPYKNVKPRIIIEEYIDGGENLNDYKLMCFNGKMEMSFVCTDRYNDDGLKVTFFDKDWQKLPFTRHYPAAKENISKPKYYDEMVKVAEKLAKDMPFVRIDFYEVGDRIYVGELTFYPGSGFEEFSDYEWDEKIGDMLDLSGVMGG